MIDILSKTYRDEYGCNFIVAIPTNVFGQNDQYHLENSHVIPGIIHKVYLAKKENKKSVELWGTGAEMRDFIFADDLARALVCLMKKYDGREPVNIASGKELSIRYITEKICKYFRFTGDIIWNKQMSGQFRKPVDISKIKSIGWRPCNSIDEKLKISCEWFKNNYPNVRGGTK
jgi:GDP-L-fucose synthase